MRDWVGGRQTTEWKAKEDVGKTGPGTRPIQPQRSPPHIPTTATEDGVRAGSHCIFLDNKETPKFSWDSWLCGGEEAIVAACEH